MRRRNLSVVLLVLGCNSGGSQALPRDASVEGASDATTTGDGSPEPEDAGADGFEASGAPPCLPIDASLPQPSNDCVYAGRCPASCNAGTASAYVCNAGAEGGATYPAVFNPPADTVNILGTIPSAYPWDATAYLSCAGLTCTRWATADHVNGGSAWSADPCAEAGTEAGPTTEAWACPTSPGVLPPPAGCVAAGDLQDIGGGDSGIPVDTVWCCPGPSEAADAGEDATVDAAAE